MTDASGPRAREAELAAHYSQCDDLLRERDRDVWLACLFAPREARPHIHAIYAFTSEVCDVRARVSQPLLGEMRLRWWTDARAAEATGSDAAVGARAHPIVDALADTIARFALPRAEAAALVDAHIFDLYDDPMPTLAALDAYCRETVAAPMRWAAHILGVGNSPDAASALDDAGVALGLTRLLRALPWQAAAGQVFVPADLLARHGATPEDFRARAATPGLLDALKELRAYARERYEGARTAAREMAAGREALLPAAVVPLSR